MNIKQLNELKSIILDTIESKITNENNKYIDDVMKKLVEWRKEIFSIEINFNNSNETKNISKDHIDEYLEKNFSLDDESINLQEVDNLVIEILIKMNFIKKPIMTDQQNIRTIIYLHKLLCLYMEDFKFEINEYQFKLIPYFKPEN